MNEYYELLDAIDAPPMNLIILREEIEKLKLMSRALTVEERISAANRLIDKFIEDEGKPPEGRPLFALADIILRKEFEDDDFPILSDREQARKSKRNKRLEVIPFEEVPFTPSMNIATDGIDYTRNIRKIKQ